MATELGKIAEMLEAAPSTQTPLQKRLAVFGRQLALAVLAICATVFAAGVLRGEPVLLILLTALSLAVAAVPEALPAVVTVMLALGARKMARRNALVRRPPGGRDPRLGKLHLQRQDRHIDPQRDACGGGVRLG
jgi:Ca2+-transporting ATPase